MTLPSPHETQKKAASNNKGKTQNGGSFKRKNLLKRWGPLGLICAITALIFITGLHKFISFETLREHQLTLLDFVDKNTGLATLFFVLIYALVVALSIPGGVILTITGGFLFGPFLGTALTVVAATCGATLIFIAAKTALGESLRQRAGSFVDKFSEGFRKNAFSYMLFLRLVPLFPFWLVNVVPAMLGLSLKVYIITTSVGIIPGTFVFSWIGNSAGTLLEQGQDINVSVFWNIEIIGPIIGLAVLALVPVVYKWFSKTEKV